MTRRTENEFLGGGHHIQSKRDLILITLPSKPVEHAVREEKSWYQQREKGCSNHCEDEY